MYPIFSLEWYPGFIRRAVLGCGLKDVVRFRSNTHCMSKPFLCESDTNNNSLAVMNQAWEALLCCTLRQVCDENYNPESIISAINWTYCETASGHITSTQAEFDKLFVKIVCTAFSVCTTAPTKNVPCFESHWKAKTEDGQISRHLRWKFIQTHKLRSDAKLIRWVERWSRRCQSTEETMASLLCLKCGIENTTTMFISCRKFMMSVKWQDAMGLRELLCVSGIQS